MNLEDLVLHHRALDAPLMPSKEWWGIFNLFTTIAIVIGSIVIGSLIIAAVKYRYREGQPEPSDSIKPGRVPSERGGPKVIIVITLIVVVALMMAEGSTFTVYDTYQKFAESSMENGDVLKIEVTAFQWDWRFKYPNGVETVGEVYIPEDTPVLFIVTSIDVKHKFGIPELKTGVDAIPDDMGYLWLYVEDPGEYEIRCYELCGVGHTFMTGKLKVLSGQEFVNWYSSMGGG